MKRGVVISVDNACSTHNAGIVECVLKQSHKTCNKYDDVIVGDSIVKLLLLYDCVGGCLIEHACKRCDAKIVDVLLKHGIIRNYFYGLACAFTGNNFSVVKLLLTWYKYSHTYMVHDELVKFCDVEVVDYVIKHGIEKINYEQFLCCAVMNNNLDVVRLVAPHVKDLNDALRHACRNSYVEIVQCLCDNKPEYLGTILPNNIEDDLRKFLNDI
jgi:ankyrin repeat protein